MNSKRLLLFHFANEEDLLGAIRKSKELGMKIVDVFSPYAIHGMDEAMGFKFSRLKWAGFIYGALGALLIAWFQIWVSADSWALNVGGKPFNSFPAFVPAMFEMMVLFAGVGVVITFFIISGLKPGKKVKMLAPEATDDKFSLILEIVDTEILPESYPELFKHFNPVEIKDIVHDGEVE